MLIDLSIGQQAADFFHSRIVVEILERLDFVSHLRTGFRLAMFQTERCDVDFANSSRGDIEDSAADWAATTHAAAAHAAAHAAAAHAAAAETATAHTTAHAAAHALAAAHAHATHAHATHAAAHATHAAHAAHATHTHTAHLGHHGYSRKGSRHFNSQGLVRLVGDDDVRFRRIFRLDDHLNRPGFHRLEHFNAIKTVNRFERLGDAIEPLLVHPLGFQFFRAGLGILSLGATGSLGTT